MWSPRTWSELEALLGIAEETPSLEFKLIRENPEERRLTLTDGDPATVPNLRTP
jgi:hypothetical protein